MTIAADTLRDELLLDVCRISPNDRDVKPEFMNDLRLAAALVGDYWPLRNGRIEHALAMLASVLTGHRRYNPTHLPFGYSGPTIQSKGWMDREDLEAVAKQIVGLKCEDADPDAVAAGVSLAVSSAVRLGFLQEKQYDAWRPGMASGSGWKSALSATPYGITKARTMAQSLMTPTDVAAVQPRRQPVIVPAADGNIATEAVAAPPAQPTAPAVPVSDPPSTPAASVVDPALRRLNEMERTCLEAMGEKGIFGLETGRLPNQETLAKWAGYPCDTTFKTALSSLVKAGYLDNGRHHGKRGGYFLTTSGRRAFDALRAA